MKLAGVEAARGLAAMLVVCVHASSILADPKDFGAPPFAGLFTFAHAGVDFFFVLSGFIILHIHHDDIGRPDRLAAYAWKRFARLVPTYWIVLCLYGALLAASPTAARHEREPLTILANALLIPLPDQTQTMIVGVAWSLQHEALFYALFALLFLSRRLGTAALALWGTLCLVNLATFRLDAFPGSFLFRLFNLEFFFGLAVAAALRHRPPPTHPRALILAGLTLFFAAGLLESWGPAFPPEYPPLHAAYATGSALALYGLVGGETTFRLPTLPGWALTLGTCSYSIYLLHVLGIMLVQHALRPLAPYVTAELAFFLAVGISTAGACAFSHLVEQPLLHRCRRPAHA